MICFNDTNGEYSKWKWMTCSEYSDDQVYFYLHGINSECKVKWIFIHTPFMSKMHIQATIYLQWWEVPVMNDEECNALFTVHSEVYCNEMI